MLTRSRISRMPSMNFTASKPTFVAEASLASWSAVAVTPRSVAPRLDVLEVLRRGAGELDLLHLLVDVVEAVEADDPVTLEALDLLLELGVRAVDHDALLKVRHGLGDGASVQVELARLLRQRRDRGETHRLVGDRVTVDHDVRPALVAPVRVGVANPSALLRALDEPEREPGPVAELPIPGLVSVALAVGLGRLVVADPNVVEHDLVAVHGLVAALAAHLLDAVLLG